MNREKILKHTSSYEDELIEDLKDLEEARSYLKASLEMYQEDDDLDALLIALRDVVKAQGSIKRLLDSDTINPEPLYQALERVAISRQYAGLN